jgi:NAD(P)H dehydrogenase (quinone)
MNCLVVSAHPLEDSLCGLLTKEITALLERRNHKVSLKDLYRDRFNPVLTAEERRTYYDEKFDATSVEEEIRQLRQTQCLVLVFPTWWFGFPAILKGWFDRVWAPGYAYSHARDLGRITPRLDNLKQVVAITTLGSPWWVDVFVLRRPVRRILRRALLGACTRQCSFRMVSVYKCEQLTGKQVRKIIQRVNKTFSFF